MFRSGKTRKKDVVHFEYNLENNLFTLHDELRTLTYRHGNYERFIINDPKKREIHKATIIDRIVHTLVAKSLEKIYEPVFIKNSYSCRVNKGIHGALNDIVISTRKSSNNYSKNFWYLKCDIKQFFANIDHRTLIDVLKKKIKDEKLLWLLNQTIGSYNKNPNKGLPLGNFTSQWLANIYLNELDYYVKHELRIKFYYRYADDFLIFNSNRKYLELYYNNIEKFLYNKLRLNFHKGKTVFSKFNRGIDFVGYRILPHYIIIRKKLRKRMIKKVNNSMMSFVKQEIGYCQHYERLNSYLGWLKHCSGYKLSNNLIHKIDQYAKIGKIY